MSWSGYTDSMTAGGCELAGIFGLQHLDPWACTPNFNPQSSEIGKVLEMIRGQGDMTTGCCLAGQKYTVISFSEGSHMLLKAKGEQEEKLLVCCGISDTALLIGGVRGAKERQVQVIVGNLTDYLKNQSR